MKIEQLFEGVELSEDVKQNITTVIESAVDARAEALVEDYNKEVEKATIQIAEEYNKKMVETNEAVDVYIEEEVMPNITESVEKYLSYVAGKWVNENKAELESQEKVAMAESLMDSFKGLVESHNMDVEEKPIEESKHEDNLILKIEENIKLQEEVDNLKKQQKIKEICFDLSECQIEKVSKLVSEHKLDENFETRIKTVKLTFVEDKAPEKEPEPIQENNQSDFDKQILAAI